MSPRITPAHPSTLTSHAAVHTRGLLALALIAGLAACHREPADDTALADPAPQTDATQAAAAPTAPAGASAGTSADTSANAASAAAVTPEVLKAIVDGSMRSAYGDNAFDAAKGCWNHSFETANDALDYCMKAGQPEVVNAPSGTQVYFQAWSDPGAGMYALVDPGLRGLFAVTVAADGTWKPLASTPSIDQGQAGDCGCQSAKLVQVGPERHGWLSTAGGTWQGTSVGQHALYVPVSGAFVNVSRIPQQRETAQDETVVIAIDPTGTPVDGFYPITATRQRDGTPVGSTQIAYDPKQKAYPWAQ